MKLGKGSKVEVWLEDGWVQCAVESVWRGRDLETKQRVCTYSVAGTTDDGRTWGIDRVPESYLRKQHAARGRKKVLRAHSVKLESFT